MSLMVFTWWVSRTAVLFFVAGARNKAKASLDLANPITSQDLLPSKAALIIITLDNRYPVKLILDIHMYFLSQKSTILTLCIKAY